MIVAASDLPADAAAVAGRLELEVSPGGRHDGLGTENKIVRLAEGFVEVLAVADPAESEQSEAGRLLAAGSRRRPAGCWAGWSGRRTSRPSPPASA